MGTTSPRPASAFAARAILAVGAEHLDVHQPLHDDVALEAAAALVTQARRGLRGGGEPAGVADGYVAILRAHAVHARGTNGPLGRIHTQLGTSSNTKEDK